MCFSAWVVVCVCKGVHLISSGISAPSLSPEHRGMEREEEGRQIEAFSLV